jgi:hypothetical protein
MVIEVVMVIAMVTAMTVMVIVMVTLMVIMRGWSRCPSVWDPYMYSEHTKVVE